MPLMTTPKAFGIRSLCLRPTEPTTLPSHPLSVFSRWILLVASTSLPLFEQTHQPSFVYQLARRLPRTTSAIVLIHIPVRKHNVSEKVSFRRCPGGHCSKVLRRPDFPFSTCTPFHRLQSISRRPTRTVIAPDCLSGHPFPPFRVSEEFQGDQPGQATLRTVSGSNHPHGHHRALFKLGLNYFPTSRQPPEHPADKKPHVNLRCWTAPPLPPPLVDSTAMV